MKSKITFSTEFIQSYTGSSQELIRIINSLEQLIETGLLDMASNSVTLGCDGFDKVLELNIS